MRELKGILVAVLMGLMIAVGAWAQGNGNNNRPPKDPQKVVDKGKEKPPPKNNNSDKRGKP
jgi:hypothetical protein